jgi:hypothetical protein
MMGDVSPETCWASYKCKIIKFWYIVASCWIFLYKLYYDARTHKHQYSINITIITVVLVYMSITCCCGTSLQFPKELNQRWANQNSFHMLCLVIKGLETHPGVLNLFHVNDLEENR